MELRGSGFSSTIEDSPTTDRLTTRDKLARKVLAAIGVFATLTSVTGSSESSPQEFPYEPGSTLVILGDSWAGGSGEGPFEEGTNEPGPGGNRCRRSDNTGVHQLAEKHDAEVVNIACNASQIESMSHGIYHESPQLDQLQELVNSDIDIRAVFIGIGGNNATDIQEFMNECVENGCPPDSPMVQNTKSTAESKEFKNSLKNLYAEVAITAPDADIYTLPYPNPLPEGSLCAGLVGEDIAQSIQTLIPSLNESISEATELAQQEGYNIFQVPAFDLSACNVVSPPFTLSQEDPLAFGHPNRAGYSAIGDEIEKTILNSYVTSESRE